MYKNHEKGDNEVMYKVAILGYGGQAERHHAPAFAKHPDCEIVAVCDMVEERVKLGAATYGVPAYLDADEMLDQEEIDIVNIPVGEQYRFELVMKCLKRDKHIYTEKPLAGEPGGMKIRLSDIPKTRAMIDEWQKHDVQFGICFCLHGGSNVRWAKEFIPNHLSEYGDLMVVQGRCAWGSWNHLIDLFRFFGGEVAEVSAYAYDPEKWYAKAVAVKFENDAVGNLMSCASLALQYELKWVARKGEVVIQDIGGTARARARNSYEYRVFNEQGSLRHSTFLTLFDEHIAEFVGSIKEGKPFDADGWAGLRHMEIDAAISESIVTGQPVKVERYLPEKGHNIFTK